MFESRDSHDEKSSVMDDGGSKKGNVFESMDDAREKIRKTLRKTKDRVKEGVRQINDKAMPHIRKAVTGNKNIRIRDFRKTPPVVRFVDKMSFFFGVCTLLVAEGVFLRAPEMLWIVFLLLCPLLIAIRLPLYYMEKYHFFTLDFCYFVNFTYVICVAIQAVEVFGPADVRSAIQSGIRAIGATDASLEDFNAMLLRLIFALTTGPLMCAIWVWRNSAVFHSLDKMTSFYIHFIPAFLSFCQRWYTNDNGVRKHAYDLGFVMCRDEDVDASSTVGTTTRLCASGCSLREWIVVPLMMYVGWQVFYLLVTEVILAEHIRKDSEISTSVRWLASDRKNAFNKLTKHVCRTCGILGPEEEFDGDSYKTKAVFVATQFIYTVLTFLPVKFCFEYFEVHAVFLLITFLRALWNGAAFYIEVFAVRYVRKFKRSDATTPASTPGTSPNLEPMTPPSASPPALRNRRDGGSTGKKRR